MGLFGEGTHEESPQVYTGLFPEFESKVQCVLVFPNACDLGLTADMKHAARCPALLNPATANSAMRKALVGHVDWICNPTLGPGLR